MNVLVFERQMGVVMMLPHEAGHQGHQVVLVRVRFDDRMPPLRGMYRLGRTVWEWEDASIAFI
jgi:hypothetical protein